jgi:hypothetical protein
LLTQPGCQREMLKLTFEIRQFCGCVVARLG